MKSSGIYITSNFVRITQAKIEKNNQQILKEFQLDISSLKKEEIPFRLKEFLKENKIDCDHLTLCIPRSQVSVRYVNLPSVDNKEIKRMIELELNNLLPYKPEELIFDQVIIERRSDGYSRVMPVAAQREVILRELSLFKQAGMLPDDIDISTVSLFNQFYEQKRDPAVNYLLINLEDNLLDILVVQKGKLAFSRGVKFRQGEGGQRFIKEVKENINIQETKGIKIDKLVLSGRGIDLKSLAQDLKQALSIKVELDEAICVTRGPALRSKYNALNINLLPKEVESQKSIGKRQKSVLYLITLLVLNASLIANILFFKMRQRQEYLYLLQSEIKRIESEASLVQEKLLKTQVLKSYFNSGRLTLGLLSELYRIAPGGLYLTSLEIRGQSPSGALVLTGQAKDTETVLKFTSLIKDSALIDQADVNYITKRQSLSEEVVDFEIRATF